MVATMQSKAVSLQSIEQELIVLLRRIRRSSLANARLVHPDLQPAAYAIFRFVADQEPTRASDVADHLAIDKGAISRQVALLEKLGLVERRSDTGDRRVQTLVVTPDGRSRLDAMAARLRSEFAGRLSAWSSADLSSFADHLSRYNASLEL